jgi:ribosomal protein L37AE/L43A
MPQHQAMSSGHDKSIIVAKSDMPVCPACQRVMTVRQFMPSTSMIAVGETVYVCESCGTEAHRTARRE